ncbi:paralemmin-3 [Hyla sarda]|uniref:paralemmin-3 n=1 Tax=Hyla sarda TaxID=327740 RepID=UPI0024C251DA|nr:paralemmin-3 [Hyla sarda]XP_056426254.1 paralemmin-3 [Hyla sarda]XP_056426255.1 paralemmin-3 [Hyla sarda]XP_056426256.1 paralemmin-3 [Hyla sarda]XP_056426257.1 paralemmin-3 [Hyla sarda]XP_056426258.1 paralemmin-3 [Hyla sarda]XP_056426259.1 paralemmin-3 [Hyla sarda]XP_056426260.1 paralemmin-3 [Hyla sarda]XP_056426261.1 paralemmin-3 [Hyla sarda]
MGETQIYSQRLHGITEKRRILDEVDRIQRDLELQKLKLQQLKRKSLRDRWLMDGLVPSPGAEIENPLNDTEVKIKTLEHELESLQLQLLYLENPELKIANLKKHQAPDPHRQVMNGDPSQQISDQKDPTPEKRETQKEHKVIKEEDMQPNGEDEKQGEGVEPSQKDPAPIKVVVVGHPIPAPRGKKVEKNQDHTSPDHRHHNVDQGNKEEHDKKTQDKENLNFNHKPQDDRFENLGPNEQLEDESHDHDQVHGYTDQPSNQNSECLEKRLELEEENLEHLTKGLERIDLSFSEEGSKVDVSQPSLSNEDIRNDLDNQYNVVKVILLEKSDQDESKTQPSPVMVKQPEDQGESLVRDNNNQDVEEKLVLVSVSVIQDQNEEVILPVIYQDQNEESALPRCQEEPVDPMPVLISHNKDQDWESTSFPAHQSLVLLSSEQEQSPKLPCKDPSPSLPCVAPVSQVQISQVVVISTSGHTSSEEPAQPSSGSQPSPSTDLRNHPATTEANTPAENQPLLRKPAETDDQSGPHGTNTAETRDKNPTGKKKSCQCCVVM